MKFYLPNICKLHSPITGTVLLLMAICYPAYSKADEPRRFITLTFENDLFTGQDDGFTNGIGITLGSAAFAHFSPDNLPGWLHWLTKNLYISTMEDKQRGVAHMFFQRMQTPEDIGEPSLIKNDLPYAGLIAWQGTLYAWDDQVSDQFSLYLGAVGPVSLAEQAQTLIHKALGSEDPEGWDNQIENEPIFKVEAQRVWRIYMAGLGRFQFDVLGLIGAGIGNLESASKGGIAVRWVNNLRSSFSTFSLQADRQVNPLALTSKRDFYVFAGVRAGYVLNDILVNGNTFTDSHSVPLEHFQDQVSGGAVWSFGDFSYVFQISSLSSRTTVLNEREKFGGLSVTYRYQ